MPRREPGAAGERQRRRRRGPGPDRGRGPWQEQGRGRGRGCSPPAESHCTRRDWRRGARRHRRRLPLLAPPGPCWAARGPAGAPPRRHRQSSLPGSAPQALPGKGPGCRAAPGCRLRPPHLPLAVPRAPPPLLLMPLLPPLLPAAPPAGAAAGGAEAFLPGRAARPRASGRGGQGQGTVKSNEGGQGQGAVKPLIRSARRRVQGRSRGDSQIEGGMPLPGGAGR